MVGEIAMKNQRLAASAEGGLVIAIVPGPASGVLAAACVAAAEVVEQPDADVVDEAESPL